MSRPVTCVGGRDTDGAPVHHKRPLSSLIDNVVSQFGGWPAARVTIKGAHLEIGRPFALARVHEERQGASRLDLLRGVLLWARI